MFLMSCNGQHTRQHCSEAQWEIASLCPAIHLNAKALALRQLRPCHPIVPSDLVCLQLALEAEVVQAFTLAELCTIHGLLAHGGVCDHQRLAGRIHADIYLASRTMLPFALHLIWRDKPR